jgi:hypothetical protein
MKYIKYLPLPNLPDDLLESVEDIINKPRSNSIVKQDYFQARPISDELQNWLEKNLSFKFIAQYQIIYYGLPIHTDEGNRKIAYNYLLALGGSNVKTMIFDDTKKLLQSETLPLRTWHSIKTDMFHGVFGLQKDNPRVSLSVTPEQ